METGIKLLAANPDQTVLKRIIDVCGAVIGLILFAPVFLLIALLLQIETPGKVLFRQERLGYGGTRFGMLKFRTMHDCAEDRLAELLQEDPKSRAEYERYQKLSGDPRLTRVGSFLRRTSLDELPQLWNVLRREMSLVGPRPFLPDQLDLYGPTFQAYQRVLPGITGQWQVSGRNRLSFSDRIRLDQEYIQNWSIRLDFQILARTPLVVFTQMGAY